MAAKVIKGGTWIESATAAPIGTLKKAPRELSNNSLRMTRDWKTQAKGISNSLKPISRDVVSAMDTAYDTAKLEINPLKRKRIIQAAKSKITRGVSQVEKQIEQHVAKVVRDTVVAKEKELKKMGLSVSEAAKKSILTKNLLHKGEEFPPGSGKTFKNRIMNAKMKAGDKVSKITSGQIRKIDGRTALLNRQLTEIQPGTTVRGGSTAKQLMFLDHNEQARKAKDVEKAMLQEAGVTFGYWRLCATHKWYGGKEICEVLASQTSPEVAQAMRDRGVDPKTADIAGLYLIDNMPEHPHPNCQCFIEAANIAIGKPPIPVKPDGTPLIKGKPVQPVGIKETPLQRDVRTHIDAERSRIKTDFGNLNDDKKRLVNNKVDSINEVHKLIHDPKLSPEAKKILERISKDFQTDLDDMGMIPRPKICRSPCIPAKKVGLNPKKTKTYKYENVDALNTYEKSPIKDWLTTDYAKIKSVFLHDSSPYYNKKWLSMGVEEQNRITKVAENFETILGEIKPTKCVLYRASALEKSRLQQMLDGIQKKKEVVFNLDVPSSATSSKAVSNKYRDAVMTRLEDVIGEKAAEKYTAVEYIIKNKSGINCEKLSRSFGYAENEHILRRFTSYKVTGVKTKISKQGDWHYIVNLEECSKPTMFVSKVPKVIKPAPRIPTPDILPKPPRPKRKVTPGVKGGTYEKTEIFVTDKMEAKGWELSRVQGYDAEGSSRYLTFRRKNLEEGVFDVRVSDHVAPEGGGFRTVTTGGFTESGRLGDADIHLIITNKKQLPAKAWADKKTLPEMKRKWAAERRAERAEETSYAPTVTPELKAAWAAGEKAMADARAAGMSIKQTKDARIYRNTVNAYLRKK